MQSAARLPVEREEAGPLKSAGSGCAKSSEDSSPDINSDAPASNPGPAGVLAAGDGDRHR